ncbi:MAG: hypothetical protein KAT16_09915 [Candidatus Heimdallarchaeota archaeon]|nr:hypothetical protein [Candidatus Heimdallarchaeota archaeon]
MKASWFTFPVEIQALDWPWKSDFPQEDLVPLLNDFFKYPATFDLLYDFHEVTRPEFGLVRSIKVISPNFSEKKKKTDFFAIRIFQKSLLDDSAIDLAKYHQRRIKKLIGSLGSSHYPQTYFLESTKFIVVLQPFLFSPVCDFTLSVDVLNLLELIYLSSKARILLDYNHNHFLRVNNEQLYYVDSDYMGNKYPDEQSALEANLNQAMIFITQKNARFIPLELLSLSEDQKGLREFSKSVINALNKFILLCKNDWENTSPKLRAKIQSLEVALRSINI